MSIPVIPSDTTWNNPVSCSSKKTLVGQHRGKNLEVVVDAARTMAIMPQKSAKAPVQERSLTRTPGYMPFFRTSEAQTIPTPLLDAPAFNAMSSQFQQNDITVNDPEFSSSSVRPKTLATIFNTFCNSFRERYSLNTPRIDRSDQVEKVRHRLFAVLTGVLVTVTTLTVVLVGLKISVILWSLEPVLNWADHVCCALMIQFLSICIAVMLIQLCVCLMAGLAFLITAVVTAGMETYEKLSQNNETAQDKFMNKYRRMEKQLTHLKELYHREFHKNSCPDGGCPGSVNVDSQADDSISEKIKKALRRVDLWSDKIMLSFAYDSNMKDIRQALEMAISVTEEWLDNAKRQKDLIDDGVEMDLMNSEPDA